MSEYRYRVLVTFDSEKECFVARAPELEQCSAEGETPETAMKGLYEEIEAQVTNIKEAGGRVPRPVDEDEVSGEVTLKISKSLHRELRWLARLEELAEEELASELFQAALSHRLSQKPRRRRTGQPHQKQGGEDKQPTEDRDGGERRGRGRRDRGRGRYHQIMDDRANFIEYVRGLEGGGGRGGRGGGGGGRRR